MRKLIIGLLVMGIMIVSSAITLAQPLQNNDYAFNKTGEGYGYGHGCHYYDGDRDYTPYGGCHGYR